MGNQEQNFGWIALGIIVFIVIFAIILLIVLKSKFWKNIKLLNQNNDTPKKSKLQSNEKIEVSQCGNINNKSPKNNDNPLYETIMNQNSTYEVETDSENYPKLTLPAPILTKY